MTTCRNINKSVLTVFRDFLKYLPQNKALLAQKLLRIFFFQNLFPAILRQKKSSYGHYKPREGVKALVAGPLRKELFLRLPLLRRS